MTFDKCSFVLEHENDFKIDPCLYYYFLSIKNKKSADNLRSDWCNENNLVTLPKPIWSGWNAINSPICDLTLLPEYSFFLQFNFKLKKPYISKDENEFYIIDNPIRKDKVFGLPYVAPSSWKGSLRFAINQLDKFGTEQIRRIFGNEKSDSESLQKGSLYFYPTFFTEKSVEVINPHERDTRKGKNPIYFECVPVDADGLFSILYIPMENKIKTINISQDLRVICEGIKSLFTANGFGAKTSSGFGIAEPEIKGKLIFKAKNIVKPQKEVLKPQIPASFEKYLNGEGTVKKEFKGNGESGLLSNKQYSTEDLKIGGSLSEFKKFKHWFNQNGEQWKSYVQSKNVAKPKWPAWTFKSFNDLINQTKEINDLLMEIEGD